MNTIPGITNWEYTGFPAFLRIIPFSLMDNILLLGNIKIVSTGASWPSLLGLL